MKKLFTLLTAAILLFSFSAGAYAEKANGVSAESEAQKRILSLKIMEGYEDGSFGADKNLTRAEFSAVIVRLLNVEDAASNNGSSQYIDVASDSWAKASIDLVTQLGYMQGVGDQRFDPENNVTYEQAVKVLVKVLGYDVMAQQNAGDVYTPYMVTASSIGLLRRISLEGSQPLTRGQLAVLLDNALDIPLMVLNGKGEYEIDDDATLLDNFLRDGAELSGVVEATSEVSLKGDVKLDDDEVLISGYRYKVGTTNAKELLGMTVSFYMIDIDGEAYIQGIYPAKNKNTTLTLAGEDVVSADRSRLTYLDEDDNEEDVDISGGQIIYNGGLFSGVAEEILTAPNAQLRLLDNNGDEEYDWLFVDAYELAQVLKHNPVDEAVYLQATLKSGTRSIEYGDEDKNVTLLNCEGTEIEPEKLAVEDLWLEIYESSDGKNLKVIALDKVFNGKIESLDSAGGETVIDGETYSFAKDAVGYFVQPSTLRVGEYYSFTLDSSERIVYAEEGEETGDYQYGYIYGISDEGNGLTSELRLKLINGTKVANFEENDRYYIQGKEKQEILIRNVAQKVWINNEAYKDLSKAAEKLATITNPSSKDELARGNVIRYRLNENNEINRIEILDPYGEYVSRNLNAEQMVLGGDDTPFGFDETTIMFFIPESGNEDDIACDMKFTTDTYNTLGFEFDDETSIVSAAIFQSPLSVYDESDFGADEKTKIVQAVTKGVDESGSIIYRISGYDRDGIFNRTTRSGISSVDEVAEQLKRGDVIQFSTDFDGQINRIKKIVSMPDSDEYYHDGAQTANEIMYGIASEADKNYLGVGATEYQNRLEIALDEDESDVTSFPMPVKETSAPDIYIYYTNRNLVSDGDFDDIITMDQVGAEDASRVVLYASNGTVKTIVIIK